MSYFDGRSTPTVASMMGDTHMSVTGGTQTEPTALRTGTWSWLSSHKAQELPVNGHQSFS